MPTYLLDRPILYRSPSFHNQIPHLDSKILPVHLWKLGEGHQVLSLTGFDPGS
jgi:hypothetical protein